MNDDTISIDRAILLDIEQFLSRLAGHAEVVQAVEQKMGCGDFFQHVMESLSRLNRPQPSGTDLLRACLEALDVADEECSCDVVTVCSRCAKIARARGLLLGGGEGPGRLEPRLRVRLTASRRGTVGDVLVFVPSGVVGTVEEASADGLCVVWDWAVVCGDELPGQVRRWFEEGGVPVDAVEFAGVEV
jgi:hypothetical protein